MSADPPIVKLTNRVKTAVVGATGAAGGTLLRVLQEREFPFAELRLLASERSAGISLRVGDDQIPVGVVDEAALADIDIAFFAAGSSTSRHYAPMVAAGGGIAVDKSSAYRMDPAVPLVVPEVNAADISAHHGIIANPNCVAIPLSIVLAPLAREFGLSHVTMATYQAASGGGRHLAEELREQSRADAAGEQPAHSVYPHVLYGNVVPGGWPMHGDDTEEELKVIAETRRVLGLADLRISVTTVRVPVAVGHSAAVWIECAGAVKPVDARRVLATAPGVRVFDDPATQMYPTPRAAAGQDDVLVGRIRADLGSPGALVLFFSADNLRKGAATNAIQVAELALAGLASRA